MFPRKPNHTYNYPKPSKIHTHFFQDNPYTFEERHARLSEPLEPVQRQASLSEPTLNLYPTLPQDLNRLRHISQNQNTVEVNRQIVHPGRNRNFQTSRVTFSYLNPQHHQAQKALVLHYQTLLRSLHKLTHQISLQTI